MSLTPEPDPPAAAAGPGVTEERSTPVEPDPHFRAIILRILEAQVVDRSRMARLLHDELAQYLSAAGMQLDILRMDLEDRVPEIGARTAEIQHILEQIVTRIRDLSYDLNPEIVERAGLQVALDRLVGRSRAVFPGKLRLLCDSSVRVPVAAACGMHRIAEQAVDNAVRHSGATRIEIILKSTRRGLMIEVRDDGHGFDLDGARRLPRGLGLVVMEHYAEKTGLTLEIKSHEQGTIVRGLLEGSAANGVQPC